MSHGWRGVIHSDERGDGARGARPMRASSFFAPCSTGRHGISRPEDIRPRAAEASEIPAVADSEVRAPAQRFRRDRGIRILVAALAVPVEAAPSSSRRYDRRPASLASPAHFLRAGEVEIAYLPTVRRGRPEDHSPAAPACATAMSSSTELPEQPTAPMIVPDLSRINSPPPKTTKPPLVTSMP